MTKRKRVYGRVEHTVPIQIYVNESEREALTALAKLHELSVSGLVRGWIKRASARAWVKRAREPKAPPSDPRQLTIGGAS